MEELMAEQSKERTALKKAHDEQRVALKVQQGTERSELKAGQLEQMRVAREKVAAAKAEASE